MNKVDRVHPRERLLPYLAALGDAILPRGRPGSALRSDNVAALRRAIAEHLPAGPALFPEGELTDRGIAFRIAEMIREKLTLELNQEVPYGIAVEVERLARARRAAHGRCGHLGGPRGPEAHRDRRRGRRLKRVGTRRAPHAQRDTPERLHLNLWVKVRENWADNARALEGTGTRMTPHIRRTGSP